MDAFELIYNSLPLLAKGTATTLGLWAVAACISFSLGTFLGVIRADRIRIPFVSRLFDIFTFIFRGTPFFVQLLIVYYVLPDLFGINLPGFIAGALTLGICSASYVSQMLRGAINAVLPGQWEAATVLGYTRLQTVWHIILPQVFITMLPALASELDQLVKSTAIISTIGVLDLTLAGMNIVARFLHPMPIYCTIALVYLAISSAILASAHLLERRFSYGRR